MGKYIFRILITIIWLICTLLFVLIGLLENTTTIFTGQEYCKYSNNWGYIYMPILGRLNEIAQIELYVPPKHDHGESDV